MAFYQNFLTLCNDRGVTPSRAAINAGTTKTSVTRWKNGATPSDATLQRLADYFGVSVEELTADRYKSPSVTEDYVTFPVIGQVAAGYEHIAYEDWTGDAVDIPKSYLKGRRPEDFFCLRVTGDSMYPQYQNGDVVLIYKQETMNRSGEIGVVVYGDEMATLKRVEYTAGQSWMRLSPINPNYPPITLRDEQLDHCRILGVPKLLIREISD